MTDRPRKIITTLTTRPRLFLGWGKTNRNISIGTTNKKGYSWEGENAGSLTYSSYSSYTCIIKKEILKIAGFQQLLG